MHFILYYTFFVAFLAIYFKISLENKLTSDVSGFGKLTIKNYETIVFISIAGKRTGSLRALQTQKMFRAATHKVSPHLVAVSMHSRILPVYLL